MTVKNFSEIADRLIAVDTEYQSLEFFAGASLIEREAGIHRVWCASFTHDGEAFSVWVGESETSGKAVLDAAAEHFGISNPVFVSFYFEAEWEAFKRLCVDIAEYEWIDVFLLYRLYRNCFSLGGEQSLAACCMEILGEAIDTDRKEAMRARCISGEVFGFEREIMDYCESDTALLVPALFELEKRLIARLESTRAIAINAAHRQWKGDTIAEITADLMASLKAFTRISHRGLPVNGERLKAIRAGARAIRDRRIAEFVAKYPGAFVRDLPSTKTLDGVLPAPEREPLSEDDARCEVERRTTGRKRMTSLRQLAAWYAAAVNGGAGCRWRRDDAACRKYLLADLLTRGQVSEYPLTDGGKLSLAREALDDFFAKETGTFGGDFRALTRQLTTFNGLLAEGKKDWLAAYDEQSRLIRYRSLRPFATITGRCAPSPSAGWVFGWDKSLYCVLEPAPGRWLVELDFSSEETFIQAQVFNDPAYRELYASKDIYLKTGVFTGMIPEGDFDALSKAELKAKYAPQRALLKTFTLAIGYGAGNSTLAAKTKLPLETVEAFRERYNAAFSKTTLVREALAENISTGALTSIWLANGWHALIDAKRLKSYNSPLNFPVQGTGSVILHRLVQALEREKINALATIHDAVFFEVAEGDFTTIDRVKALMVETANSVLGVKPGEPGMKVGDPEIIRHGEIWTPEHEYDDAARELLTAGGMGE